jgi:hypothetical protein
MSILMSNNGWEMRGSVYIATPTQTVPLDEVSYFMNFVTKKNNREQGGEHPQMKRKN